MPSGGQQGNKFGFGKIGITAYGTGLYQGRPLWQAIFYLFHQSVIMYTPAGNDHIFGLAGQMGQAMANRLCAQGGSGRDLIGSWQAGKIRQFQIGMKSRPVERARADKLKKRVS